MFFFASGLNSRAGAGAGTGTGIEKERETRSNESLFEKRVYPCIYSIVLSFYTNYIVMKQRTIY